MVADASERLAEAERLEKEARRSFAWAMRETEWPHHRAEYQRDGARMWKEAEAIRNEIGAPPASRFI
jgi:hypothetical protein